MPLVLWEVKDQVRASQPAGAAGVCDVAFDAVDTGYLWRVGFIAVQQTSILNTPIAQVYLDEVLPQNQRGGTINGAMDTYDASWPIAVPATRALLIHWTNCDPGTIGEVAIQYEIYKLVGDLHRPQPLY